MFVFYITFYFEQSFTWTKDSSKRMVKANKANGRFHVYGPNMFGRIHMAITR